MRLMMNLCHYQNNMLETIKQYRKINDKLHTSAQPLAEEFQSIKQTGIEVVINLARTDSPGAIANEAEIVQQNELDYIHIPVDFKNPETADLKSFFNAMEEQHDKNILVHCAYNWRVSCFVYLYRIIKQGCDYETAKQDMLAIWNPDDTWQAFIDSCLANSDSLK